MNKPQEASNGFAQVKVAFGFTQSGYIGLPCWRERNELINMSKFKAIA